MPTAILKDESQFEISDEMAAAMREYRQACEDLMHNAEWLSLHRQVNEARVKLAQLEEGANMLAGPYHKRMKDEVEKAEKLAAAAESWPPYLLFESVRADFKAGWTSVSYPVEKVRKLILSKHPELAVEFAAIAKPRKQDASLTLGYFAPEPGAPAPGNGQPPAEEKPPF